MSNRRLAAKRLLVLYPIDYARWQIRQTYGLVKSVFVGHT